MASVLNLPHCSEDTQRQLECGRVVMALELGPSALKHSSQYRPLGCHYSSMISPSVQTCERQALFANLESPYGIL